jgi:predicted house-cleaning NTP pyrophosphatase (Maf/HAM1 superfamily)
LNRNEPEDDNFLNDELEAHNLDHFPIQDIEIENQAVPVEFDIDKIKPDNKQFTSAAKSKLNKLKKSLPIAKKKNTTNRKKSTTSIRDLLFPLFSNINNNYKENMQTSNKTKITCDSDVNANRVTTIKPQREEKVKALFKQKCQNTTSTYSTVSIVDQMPTVIESI